MDVRSAYDKRVLYTVSLSLRNKNMSSDEHNSSVATKLQIEDSVPSIFATDCDLSCFHGDFAKFRLNTYSQESIFLPMVLTHRARK